MLKNILSPELLHIVPSVEGDLLSAGVYERLSLGEHSLKLAKNAKFHMDNDVSKEVYERVRNWGVTEDYLPGVHAKISASIKDDLAKSYHKNRFDLDDSSSYGESLVEWLDATDVIVPDDISELDTLAASQIIEPGMSSSYTARSDEILAARERLKNIKSPDWHVEYGPRSNDPDSTQQGSVGQTPLTLV